MILILLFQVFFVIFKTPGVSLALLPVVKLIRSYEKLIGKAAGFVLMIFHSKILFRSKLSMYLNRYISFF